MTNLQSGIDGLAQMSKDDVAQSNRAGLDFDLLASHGITRTHKTIHTSEFEAYLDAVDYNKKYPSYVKAFSKAYIELGKDASGVNRKYFEQFLSILMTKPGPGDITADIAAAYCPFANILKAFYNVDTSYHQDLDAVNTRAFPYLGGRKFFGGRESNVTFVQCNATDLPFENDEISYMYLLNSWEHFQAPSDLDFLIEAERCLQPGGKMIIVPLNAAHQGYVATDPEVWNSKQVYEAGKQPLFRKDVPVHVAKVSQVYAQHHDARLLVKFAAKTPKLRFEVVTVCLDEERPWFKQKTWNVLIAHKED